MVLRRIWRLTLCAIATTAIVTNSSRADAAEPPCQGSELAKAKAALVAAKSALDKAIAALDRANADDQKKIQTWLGPVVHRTPSSS